MPAKKKIVKHTTQSRESRLQRAKTWIEAYTGEKIVKGYAKHFRVDLLQAITDLRLSGVTVSEAYELSVKKTLTALAESRSQQRDKDLNAHLNGIGQDVHFAFIVGYTSGGAPYGLTWDELDDEEQELYSLKTTEPY